MKVGRQDKFIKNIMINIEKAEQIFRCHYLNDIGIFAPFFYLIKIWLIILLKSKRQTIRVL